jgi:hypothetical protein
MGAYLGGGGANGATAPGGTVQRKTKQIFEFKKKSAPNNL